MDQTLLSDCRGTTTSQPDECFGDPLHHSGVFV
jgi:hypothetical protein